MRKLDQKAYSLVVDTGSINFYTGLFFELLFLETGFKSIEYCYKTRLAITAGFDDTIR